MFFGIPYGPRTTFPEASNRPFLMSHRPRLDQMAFLNQYLARGMDYPQPSVAFSKLGVQSRHWRPPGPVGKVDPGSAGTLQGRMLGGPVVGGGIRKGIDVLGDQEECDEEGVCLIPKLLPPSLYLPQTPLFHTQGPCPHLLLVPGALWYAYPVLPHDLLCANIL